MSKSSVLQRIQELCTGQADDVSISKFYDDVLNDFAPRQILTVAELLAITPATAEYAPPVTCIDILAVFYDNRQLSQETLRNVEAVNAQWRDERGTPRAFVIEDESKSTFRLYPRPTVSSKDFIFLFGSPFGMDFPRYAVSVLMTENRQPTGDVPAWLEVPVAFAVLQREFMRDSDHKDLTFSDACGNIYKMLMVMVS